MTKNLNLAAAGRIARFALAAGVALSVAACQESASLDDARAYHPIPQATLALMASKGTTANAPILIRTFKKEAEFEVWKMASNGRYQYIKTFPMCRWSGQLGPKTREGDRQVPEGFYTIAPGQMNPNSHYYLSFNVGYPNAYDKAHGDTGGDIMVHGICSSAGCFSMTDQQMDEIYAIARDAFAGGQREIQMESYPFHMTAENLAKYRLDPNMPFWNELKKGYDYFDVSHQEPKVGVCGRRYVFDKSPAAGGQLDPALPCPALRDDDPKTASAVESKEQQDRLQVASLVQKGVPPVRLVYQDGGQNPDFANRVADVSRPDALVAGPVEMPMTDHSKSALIRMATAARSKMTSKGRDKEFADAKDAKHSNAPRFATTEPRQPTIAPDRIVVAAASEAPSPAPSAKLPFYRNWMSIVSEKVSGPRAPATQGSTDANSNLASSR